MYIHIYTHIHTYARPGGGGYPAAKQPYLGPGKGATSYVYIYIYIYIEI